MNVTGVIVEYNPFHNGHFYHLQKSIDQTKADLVIAVMSGNFLQRGEPALLSKWERTKMALEAGIDLVVELPYAFATQKAEIFANGAVSILDALGTTHLCFGSEQGDIQPFINTLSFTCEHQTEYDLEIKKYLKQGHSYPKSQALAFRSLNLPDMPIVDLSKPNNILGYHYLKAVKDQGSAISVDTIKRVAAEYHDANLTDNSIASATSIRQTIFAEGGQLHKIQSKVPDFTYRRLDAAQKSGSLHHWEHYYPYLFYKLITVQLEELVDIYEAEEGLEHRMLRIVERTDSFKAFMEELKTKRYTWTRLQRLCVHTLTNTKKRDMKGTLTNKLAPYIRLLGMNQKGQSYLNKRKADLSLPLITNIRKNTPPLLDLDIKAAKVYALPDHSTNKYNEISRSPLRYDETEKTWL
ncbi:putative nucleotidyltransferase [Scopulibacillus darangshiensis]|uniref:tRNA(Met) cytidine acetate ligase n=1 Tax=Scopulibacillus darangshiensis TaxID=442528 RepID=A0A4R2P8V1_9BACL|nr:nucleotidyltransferase [Scopulibacillus darangshiensis]TCP30481.1 putative nucleotidyltransferase [Scopulibacillus darangshiensis]